MINIPLPEGIHAYFYTEPCSSEILFETEKNITTEFETKRLKEFCQGRFCAHQCLNHFSNSAPILKDEYGAPVWPKGLTGSISHTDKMAGAMVAKKDRFRALGLDIELIGRVQPDLWDMLFTPNEIKVFDKTPDHKKNYMSTMFFSMKEAFYKMQFQLSHTFLDFHDCEIIYTANQYLIKPLVPIPNVSVEPGLFPVNVIQHEDTLICYSTIY
ncbi:MAG: 4'-phosphopantetheinyl transferase superfamily protein [Reichenbachiella sp.]